MSYRYDTFLKPITTTDRNIQILNTDGIVTHSVNPFSILDVMISNNLLKINLKSKRVISIPFLTTNESKLAIVRFQEQLDTLKSKVPGFIDKKIENYIEDQITSKRFNTLGATNSLVIYDFNTGSTFYHSTASTNYSANFINIPETDNKSITTKIIISQGATGYLPSSILINGVTQSVKWLGGTYSSSNSVDVIEFNFLRTNSWVEVLGQITSFS